MTTQELESMKAVKVANETNQKDLLNLSSHYSNMIKNAGRICNDYASDIMIDIDAFRKDLDELKQGETITRYIGYRDYGVDHTSFIECRDRSYYRKLQKIVASCYHRGWDGYVDVTLYDLKDRKPLSK